MKKNSVISTAILILFTYFTTMAQHDFSSYHKIGPAYLVSDTPGGQSFLFVAEYKNAKEDNWHYVLRRHALKDNHEISRKEIAFTQGGPLETGQLIGRLGDVYYVVADSLTGYDVHTLEPIVTEAIFTLANPFIKENISRQHNNYLLDEAADVLYLRAENDDRYKLYPGSLTLKPEDGNNEAAPEDYSYEVNANYRLYDRYKLKDALTNIDTAENLLYILGSKKETGSVISYFGTAIFAERDENRQLTTLPYTVNAENLFNNTKPPKTNEANYFKGAFLQHKFFTTAWKNIQGDRIILFQSNSKQQMLSVALVNKEGKEKWRIESGQAANTFIDYLVSGENLLMWFNKPNPENKAFETVLINVDLGSGDKSNLQ